jgi:hypothetical protein
MDTTDCHTITLKVEECEREKRPHVRKWYFREQCAWVVQKMDAEGNQIGEAVYVYTRAQAEREERDARIELFNELKKSTLSAS